MNNEAQSSSSRRQFLKLAVGVSIIPLIGVQSAEAQLVALEEADPQGKALQYKKSAADASSAPNYKAGSQCDNCLHFVAGTSGCNIFPGKSVEPKGWCAVWAAKPA